MKTIYYKVFKVFRKSQRREILRRNLTEAEAKRVVNSYPDSSRSMVCYTRQSAYSNAKKAMTKTEEFNRIMARVNERDREKKQQKKANSTPIKPREQMNELQQSLSLCTVKGNTVILPQEHLANYADVRKALLNAGAQYKRNTFVFANDAMPYIDRLMDNEKVNIKKEFQFFATPPELAKRLVEMADINSPHLTILEPSAGQGAIIEAILDKQPGLCVHAYELMDINRGVLAKIKDCILLGEDFIKAKPTNFDRIVANPPFSKNQDIEHTRHMYKFLAKGGRMVVINSKHWINSKQKKETEYREWLEEIGAVIEPIETGEFKSSGTMIETVVITIDKSY